MSYIFLFSPLCGEKCIFHHSKIIVYFFYQLLVYLTIANLELIIRFTVSHSVYFSYFFACRFFVLPIFQHIALVLITNIEYYNNITIYII